MKRKAESGIMSENGSGPSSRHGEKHSPASARDHWHEAGLHVKARGLACQRGERLVFSQLDFRVDAGQALSVTGANGAGKTSLLRLVAGLLPVMAGHLDLPCGAQGCHYLGHRNALKPHMTVAEDLRFWTAFLGGDNWQGAQATHLAAAGLTYQADLKTGDLSAGQGRRLALARLLGAPRPVWLLDEPLTALDAQGRDWLTALATAHLQKGGLIVAATHEPLDFSTATLNLPDPKNTGVPDA